MSLINDALQRAKRVHQETAPSSGSGLRFQPTDPSQRRGHKVGLVLPATAATILVIGILSLALSDHKTVAPKESQPAAPHMRAQGSDSPSGARASGNGSAVMPSAHAATDSGLGRNTTGASLAAAEAPTAEPTAPKLQAIVFNPTRPSAIISGKTVVIGDRVNEYLVAGISPQSITLVSETATNVLRMK